MSKPDPNQEFTNNLRKLIDDAAKNKASFHHVITELEMFKSELIQGVIMQIKITNQIQQAESILKK